MPSRFHHLRSDEWNGTQIRRKHFSIIYYLLAKAKLYFITAIIMSVIAHLTPDQLESDCSICLSRGKTRAVSRDCTHVYCYECILEWMKKNPSCPQCRKTIACLFVFGIEEVTVYRELSLFKVLWNFIGNGLLPCLMILLGFTAIFCGFLITWKILLIVIEYVTS